MEARKVGLARALSKLGFCSRSQAAKIIIAGRVRLNGGIRRDPETPVRMGRDRIEVDGGSVVAEHRVYLLLNKPRGIVTTASDEQGRETVYSLLDASLPWVAPVGRLDKASEGLLLLTNDSSWAARISDPDSHVEKTYHVQVGAQAGDREVQALLGGLRCDGEWLRAKQARVLRQGEKNTWVEIVLDEGKNRQIRRIFDELGIEVLRLVRVAIGPVALGKLEKGKFRALSAAEKNSLEAAVSLASKPGR